MHKGAFQLHKVRRFIDTQGRKFQFVSPGKNEFGEANNEDAFYVLKGVFHETQPPYSYVGVEASEGTAIRQRTSPMVMTLWENVQGISKGDKVIFNGKPYRVNDIKNLLEAGLVADISLEEVQSGCPDLSLT